MTKGQMIDEILGAAKRAAILQNKPLDTGDLFLELAFISEEGLKDILAGLKIKIKPKEGTQAPTLKTGGSHE